MLGKYKKLLELNKTVYLRIKVKPGAPKTVIKRVIEDDTVYIDVAAVPERGQANKELLKYLAKEFSVQKKNVKIISGAGERLKLIKIQL